MEPVSSGEGCSRGRGHLRDGRKHRRGTEGNVDVDSPGVYGAGTGRGRSWWKELVEPPSTACGTGRRRQGNPAEVETESDPEVEALPRPCTSMDHVPHDCRKSRGKRKNLDDCDDEMDEGEEEEEEERRRCNNDNNRKRLVRDRGLSLKRTHGDTRMGRLLAAARPRPRSPCSPTPPGRRASAPPPPPPPPPSPPLTSAKVRLKMWGRGRGRVRGSGPWERGKSRPGNVCLSDAQTQTDEGTPNCSEPSTSESSAELHGPSAEHGLQPCSLRLNTTPVAKAGTGMGMGGEEEDEEKDSSSSDSCASISKTSSQQLVTPSGYPSHSFRASAARLPTLCEPPPQPTPERFSGMCPTSRAGMRGRGGHCRRRMASPDDNGPMCYTERSRRRRRGMNRETSFQPQDCQENWSCLIF